MVCIPRVSSIRRDYIPAGHVTKDDVILDDFLQSDDPQAQSATSEDYKTNTLKELYQLLEGAVKNEDYESAAKIRDEISKRD